VAELELADDDQVEPISDVGGYPDPPPHPLVCGYIYLMYVSVGFTTVQP